MSISRPALPFLLLFAALAATFLVYYPGLNGPFVFDDLPSITENSRIAITDLGLENLKQAALSSASGPLMRPVSMLSFALNQLLTGFDPFYFKLTNLLIHCLNGIGIYVVTAQILAIYRKRFQPALSTRDLAWISLAVAGAWLLHPLNLTSVLYVVQRMTSLSAFFSIAGLIAFLWGRMQLGEGKKGILPILASLLVFTPLAILSKENGALLPVFMLSAEITLFNFRAEKRTVQLFLGGVYFLILVLPASVALFYMATHPQWLLEGYKIRNFTFFERLMTESRVMWIYIQQILIPNISEMGLFHDDLAISRGLLQPLSTIFSLAGLFGLIGLAFAARKKAPLFAFGVLFFISGHLLESTVFPLEIMHEHRNYLPMAGLLLMVFFYLLDPSRHLKSLSLRRIMAALFIVLFAFNTYSRSGEWDTLPGLFQTEVENHPDSVRTNLGMAVLYHYTQTDDPETMERNHRFATQYYQKIIALDSNDIQGYLGLIMLNTTRCKPVETEWLRNLEYRFEHAILSQGIGYQLRNFITHQARAECKLPKEAINGLIQATLRNPILDGEQRTEVLLAQSHYLINVAGDYPAALAMLYQVVNSAPKNLKNRLTLIVSLISLKHFSEAQEQLVILGRLDKLGIYDKEIRLQSAVVTMQDQKGQ